jgi:hypothetical protein
MPYESYELLPEFYRAVLNAADFDEAVRPVLSFLVGDLPAMGGIVLEREFFAQSIEEEAHLSLITAPVGFHSGGLHSGGWHSGGVHKSGAGQGRSLVPGFLPRVTHGPTPSSELARAIVAALSSRHAPVVASGLSGQTFSLCLARDEQGEAMQVLGLYTFQPLGLDAQAEERFLMVAEFLAPLLARMLQQERSSQLRDQSLRALGLALEMRGATIHGHTDGLASLVTRFGRHLNLPSSDVQALRWGSYLHDVGKLGIPDSILLNTGKLEVHEWQIMRLHPEDGLRFAKELGALPAATLQVIIEHHEHFDGTGYPHNLKGQDIALLARIFSIADAFNALTSRRPYRKPLEIPEALEELQFHAGRQFDPELLARFCELFEF